MIDQCYCYCFVFVYVEYQFVVVCEVWWFIWWVDKIVDYFIFGYQQFVDVYCKFQFFWYN